jgi:hypothetical protein
MASNSSKNNMQGAAAAALAKMSRTCSKRHKSRNFKSLVLQDSRKQSVRILTPCSDAPIYLFKSSGPFTDIKRKEQAEAATATTWVLPHPGGP